MTNTKTYTVTFDDFGQERHLLLAYASFDYTIANLDTWLIGDEIKVYNSFKATTRKNEYLAGRILAKKTIFLATEEYNPNNIEIISGVWGDPLIKAKSFSNYWLSIAHTKTEVAVLFSKFNTHPIGIDIEQISKTNQHSLQQFLSQYDQPLTLQEMHLYWSAKEAAAKALRTGFTLPETLFEIGQIQKVDAVYLIKFKNLHRLQATAWVQNNCVVCIAYPIEWTYKSLCLYDDIDDNHKTAIKTTHYD